MQEFIAAALTLPTVIFSFGLVVSIVMWALSSVGVMDMDGLGDASAVAGEAALDAGAATVKESLSVFHLLRMHGVPVTISLSFLMLAAWGTSITLEQLLAGSLGVILPGAIWRPLVFIAALAVGFGSAWVVTMPLAPLFRVHEGPGATAVIGKFVRVVTVEVNRRTGQAEMGEGADLLMIAVRADPSQQLRKGDRALIVAHDPATSTYEIERVDDGPHSA